MALYTTSEVIQIAKICQYLAADNQSRGMLLMGGYERVGLSRLIYIVRRSIEWLYTYNPSSDTLLGKVNFLFSLCQPFIGRALQIIGSGGSGTIVNPTTGVASTIVAQLVEFRIGDVDAPMNAGEITLTLDFDSVLSASVDISLDGVDLPTGNYVDRIAYNVIYTNDNIQITFNQGVAIGQVYSIRFLQYQVV